MKKGKTPVPERGLSRSPLQTLVGRLMEASPIVPRTLLQTANAIIVPSNVRNGSLLVHF
jgi:hypothetical protein